MCCSPIREGLQHIITRGLCNVGTRKRMLYRHSYIPSLPEQVFMIQSQNNVSKQLADGFNPVNTW